MNYDERCQNKAHIADISRFRTSHMSLSYCFVLVSLLCLCSTLMFQAMFESLYVCWPMFAVKKHNAIRAANQEIAINHNITLTNESVLP
jgi:hypothetical protein